MTAERLDMGILIFKGYAVKAIKKLLCKARGEDLQILVWHDADLDGCNVVRCLEEDTSFDGENRVEVIDLGLTIEDALRLREARPTEAIDHEPIGGSRELKSLDHRLTPLEREWFTGRKLRFEINAIPARWRIGHVEERLAAHGARPKHVPPVDALERLVERYYEAEIRLRVEDAIARFVDVEAIVAELMERVRDRSYSRSRRRSSANAAPRKPLNP
jgi:hypothetical protein